MTGVGVALSLVVVGIVVVVRDWVKRVVRWICERAACCSRTLYEPVIYVLYNEFRKFFTELFEVRKLFYKIINNREFAK